MKLRENHILQKGIYTFGILLVYLIGRGIPLFGIDMSAYDRGSYDSVNVLLQAVGGDDSQYSIFALGISPYILSTILIQVVMSVLDSNSKAQISPKSKTRWTLILMVIASVGQAIMKCRSLVFISDAGDPLLLYRIISVVEMSVGSLIILRMSERNRKYGIGGASVLILVNIISGLMSTLRGYSIQELILPLIISFVVLLIMIFMENIEHRTKVQRISIHNIYADKNYIAFKLNIIGVTPVMFASSFFMIPQMVGISMTEPLGIGIYIGILFVLTIVFAFIFLSPKDITEQLLKNGDSIIDVHAGPDTRRYLRGVVFRLSLLSAIVMSLCVGVPLVLRYYGYLGNLAMLPSSVMMLTGVFCSLYQEVMAMRQNESYRSLF